MAVFTCTWLESDTVMNQLGRSDSVAKRLSIYKGVRGSSYVCLFAYNSGTVEAIVIKFLG